MTQPPRPFGTLLRGLRTAAGLTQEALAARGHMSKRGIQDLERGVSTRPRRDTVELLADALGLSGADRAALAAAARPQPPVNAQPDSYPTFSSEALVPLVGRDRELELLDRFLAPARPPHDAAPLLLLAGEPGIGKTRVLQAAARRASEQGWCVLVGGCQRSGGQAPYAPLLGALEQYLQGAGAAQRRTALAGCAWLARLLPELAASLEPLPAGTLAPDQERRLIHAAVVRLLANTAGPAGTLLVLDDLQWSGPDALELLDTLARGPAPPRLLGAYRDTEVRPAEPLGLWLADLAQAGLLARHALGPLSDADAASLLRNLLGEVAPEGRTVREHVLRRAGGTPFFLVSYAQAPHLGSAETVPWSIAQGVRQRVALLSAAGQEVLGAAAIVGRRAPRALLAAAAGRERETVLEGLEAACRARLLFEDGEDAYVFSHDLIREVAEAELGAARRAVLHHRVAEALERDTGASPERLAFHFTRGGDPDRAARYLELAGDRAWEQRALSAGESHYREALDRLERLGRLHDTVRVRGKLAELLYGIGQYMAASQILEPAAEALRATGDWERLGEITARIGWMHSLAGTPKRGLALVEPLLQQLEESGAAIPLAALHAAIGQLALAAGEYPRSETANKRAAILAHAVGDRISAVRAEYNRLCICQLLGQLDAALALGRQVVPLAEETGHPNTLLAVLRDLAYIHALQGASGPSRAYIERAAEVAARMHDPGPVAYTQGMLGWILFLGGEWPRARTQLDAAVALSRGAPHSWYSPYPSIFQARVLLAVGERAEARQAAEDALELAARSGDPATLRWASQVMAKAELLEGQAEAARARLMRLLDRPGLVECDVTLFLPVLARAELMMGRLDLATATARQALSRARPQRMRLVLVEALLVEAEIALRQERWDGAARGLAEGLEMARSIPYPYAEARLLGVEGRLRARTGESEKARQCFADSRAILARLGARPESEDVAALGVP